MLLTYVICMDTSFIAGSTCFSSQNLIFVGCIRYRVYYYACFINYHTISDARVNYEIGSRTCLYAAATILFD
jgi:hypothetical protein